jgi:hypothetical protein
MSTNSSPILDAFIQGLEKAVPCYSHKREVVKNICLKKCNSMIHGKMGQIGAVRNRVTKGDFLISVKESLVDVSKRSTGQVVPNLYGRNPGLVYYVKHTSTPYDTDYKIVVQVLRIAKRHHSLPPC